MEYRDLMHFLAVAETGSVREAAARMLISQPAVSRRIIGLERQLGVMLFHRTPAGMILTQAGSSLREMALDMRNRLNRAEHVMGRLRSGRQTFILACPEVTAHYFIAPYIASGAPVAEVRTALPSDVYDDLRKGADIAVNPSVPPPHLTSLTLCSTPVLVQYAGVPPFSVVDGGAELADVVRHPMLLPGFGRAADSLVRSTAQNAGLDFALTTTTTNGVIAQAMAAAGRGNAVVLEPAAYGLHQALLLHQGKPLTVEFFAAWESGHYASKEILSFAQDLAVWFQHLTPFPKQAETSTEEPFHRTKALKRPSR